MIEIHSVGKTRYEDLTETGSENGVHKQTKVSSKQLKNERKSSYKKLALWNCHWTKGNFLYSYWTIMSFLDSIFLKNTLMTFRLS